MASFLTMQLAAQKFVTSRLFAAVIVDTGHCVARAEGRTDAHFYCTSIRRVRPSGRQAAKKAELNRYRRIVSAPSAATILFRFADSLLTLIGCVVGRRLRWTMKSWLKKRPN